MIKLETICTLAACALALWNLTLGNHMEAAAFLAAGGLWSIADNGDQT